MEIGQLFKIKKEKKLDIQNQLPDAYLVSEKRVLMAAIHEMISTYVNRHQH